jgi:enediyne biosynthesis protein E4
MLAGAFHRLFGFAALTAVASAQQGGPPAAPRVPSFTDVLAGSGIKFRHHFIDSETGSKYRINPYDHGSGVFVADVNGDGQDDIYLLDFLGPAALYLNRGEFHFEEVAAKAGVAVDRALKVGAAFGDYDNDGDPDLYVTTYRGGNHLFANAGDGTFTDVTAKAGVGYKGHSNSTTWFDCDGDGDLDLFLCNIGRFTTDTVSQEADWFFSGVALPFKEVAATPDARVPGEGCILYRNNGDGTFTDATKSAGIASAEWNGDVAVSDLDLDGDLDLYTSNMFGANHLYRNRGDGTFEEITAAALKRTSWGGMGAAFFDANGDANPDLYVVDMHSDMWLGAGEIKAVVANAKYDTPLGTAAPGGRIISSPDETRAKAVLFGNTYFENRGDGTFAEKSAGANLETWWPWGIAVGDWNDDGAQDLFVPSGMGYPYYFWPNQFLVNDGSGRFTECAAQAGLERPAKGRAIAGAEIDGKSFHRSSRAAATADFDGDGDLDLVVNNFNHEPYLYRNDSPKGHALRLKLRNKAKSAAFGARVKVTAAGRTFWRELSNAQGYIAQSSAILHVGLGAAESVDRVEVFWLGRKAAQVVDHPALDRIVTIDQE